jgi:SAM-dependent methyltransferase
MRGVFSISPGDPESVRVFYERYPYPRPVESLEKYRRSWQEPARKRAEYHLFWPNKAYRENYSILIAGCGTSQAAKYAMRWPEARVTGIDFSATSVRCTEDLKRKYNLAHLKVRQLPIEKVNELGMDFDQIVCTGVLHHLPDPGAGLTALRGVLKPGGAMHIMVYAPYGRTGIYMLQEYCRRVGIRATDEGIRDLVLSLRALPPGHPLENLLRETPDFRHEAGLADALLHPRDRAYTVLEVFDFIEKAGLNFGRWIKQAPYSPLCGVMAQIPQAAHISSLPLCEQYSAAELFRGTMVRHSLVAYRNDSPACQRQIDFSSDDWLEFVPIRMPDTICVRERLPEGAAGILINRTHTYRDLYLAINPLEKRLLDAIDGSLCIGEILDQTLTSVQKATQREVAGSFFERIWWYDQLVFNCSGQSDG